MAGMVVVEVTVTVLDSRQKAAGPDFISPSNPEESVLLPALTETALVKYVLPNSLPSFLYLVKGESPTHFRKQPLQLEGSLENIKSKPFLLCTPFYRGKNCGRECKAAYLMQAMNPIPKSTEDQFVFILFCGLVWVGRMGGGAGQLI